MLARLFQHLAWADAAVRDALAARPPGSPAGERALRIFGHVLGAEQVWLARLRGVPSPVPVWPTLDLAGAAMLTERTAADLLAYVEGTNPDELAREMAYTNSAGREFRSRVDDIFLHVALHGSYHRGQIALLVRESGGEPASTDYIGFVRGAPAATTKLG